MPLTNEYRTDLAGTWAGWSFSPSFGIGTATGGTLTNSTVWAGWNQTWSSTITVGGYPTPSAAYWPWPTTSPNTVAEVAYWGGWNTAYVETAESRRARESALRERAAIERERLARREVAEVRARQLLHEHLSAAQKRDILAHGWFELRSDTGRRWRIRAAGIVGNVDLMPEDGSGIREASYCAHPGDHSLPRSDHHLAQKLALETDEAGFLAVANVHHRRRVA